MEKTLHCKVSGRVHGVAFRYFVLGEATRLNLTGYVRNLPGGQLEIKAQGQDQALDKFLESVRLGPPLARVDQVETAWPSEEQRFEQFEIRR
jgi:acylphosphatase